MSTLITFAANSDSFRKRKRVFRACEACKKRRTRCSHTFSHSEQGELAGASSPRESLGPRRSASNSPDSKAAQGSSLGQPSNDDEVEERCPPRFLGHLSPEATFRGAAPPCNGSHQNEQHECGYWVSDDEGTRRSPSVQGIRSTGAGGTISRKGTLESSRIKRAREVYLAAINVSMLPPTNDENALVDIYFAYVHPILPLLDQSSFEKLRAEGRASTLLRQAICVVAAKHDLSRNYLRFKDESKLMEQRDFANRLYFSVRTALEARLEADRITLIQVLVLLSLHSEGCEGAEQSSMHLSQAIHHAHTFGLHFDRSQTQSRDHTLTRLFWCLWALDKLNASINGRPQLMHNRDSRSESLAFNPSHQHSAFGVWLQITEVLDKITEFYRPNADPNTTGWESDFPAFEDMLADCEGDMESTTIAVLELYYHAVAILSHRSRTLNDATPSTPSSIRQSLSAVRVTLILSSEAPHGLPPLPVVPYALSLATAVAYRQFRQSRLQTHKRRAKRDLETCCQLLTTMKRAWWSAEAIADLACAALNMAEATSSSIASAAKSAEQVGDQPDTQDSTTEQGVSPLQPFDAERPLQKQVARAKYSGMSPSLAEVLPGALHDQIGDGPPVEASSPADVTFTDSLDWLNFDNAFDNLDVFLWSTGEDTSTEMLRPFSLDGSWNS